jgi:hypothetical protein
VVAANTPISCANIALAAPTERASSIKIGVEGNIHQEFGECFMTVKIDTVQINLASEHLLLIGVALWAMVPRIRHLLKKKK